MKEKRKVNAGSLPTNEVAMDVVKSNAPQWRVHKMNKEIESLSACACVRV